MSTILPVNLDALLHGRGVESERVEFKASWDEHTTGPQVLRTMCAFANDYHNLNGGYVVIGVAERAGRAVLPPTGLSANDVEEAQKWIRGNSNRLDPPYPPILSPEAISGRHILVVWAPASEMRPHRAPATDGGASRYWVRLGSETVDAERRGDLLRGLIQQTARVPWDDRRALDAQVEDLREVKVREYLRDVGSGLLDEPSERDIYRRMRLTMQVNDHESPRNVSLLFFSKDPSTWFRGARIEVVQFAADRAGDVQEERTFGGGLVDQLRDCLNYLENLSAFHLQKQRDRSRVRGWINYPQPAVRETLVNALYHRGYDVDQPEPTKVYLHPNRIEVISYPGPVPGIEPRHLLPNAEVRAAPARNRRIGEFLKELGLAEGRLSGLAKVFREMDANGSPVPRFDFDEQRTYFQHVGLFPLVGHDVPLKRVPQALDDGAPGRGRRLPADLPVPARQPAGEKFLLRECEIVHRQTQRLAHGREAALGELLHDVDLQHLSLVVKREGLEVRLGKAAPFPLLQPDRHGRAEHRQPLVEADHLQLCKQNNQSLNF